MCFIYVRIYLGETLKHIKDKIKKFLLKNIKFYVNRIETLRLNQCK